MSGFLRIIPIILSANTDDTLDDTIDKRCINLLLLSTGRIHLYLALLSHRDYFRRSNSSLSGFSVPQGLFQPTGFIPPLLFCSTRIISADQMHLYLALLFHRDAFHRPDSSLSCSFVPQGLFCPSQMHLYLALLLHRDYFSSTSNLRSQPDTHFAVDMFPYKKAELFQKSGY